MRFTSRMRWRLRGGVVGIAAAALAVGEIALAQSSGHDYLVRVVIPEDVPAFDHSAFERHDKAILPRALVFPEAPGENDISLVLLNPRYADPETVVSALSLLERALQEGRTHILLVSSRTPRPRLHGADSTAAVRELTRLKASPRVNVPKLGFGRMIEVRRTWGALVGGVD